MLLIEKPNCFMPTTAATSDKGSASSVMAAARTLSRKTNTTNTTRIAPSRSAEVRLSNARSMKSACRKMWRLILMPAGSVR